MGRRPRPLSAGSRAREGGLVALGALAVAGLVTLAGPRDLRADQHAYALLVVRLLDPATLARDALYGHAPTLLHVPSFLHLHAAVARWLGGDVEAALLALAWPMGALYLAGHYVLFRAVSGSPAAAALAALGALTVRNAPGGEFWGFDGARAAASRTVLAGLAPALLLAFLRWRTHPTFPGYFLLLGLLANVHPVSAAHLAQATAAAHVALGRLAPRALAGAALGVPLFVLGASPYLVPFAAGRAGGGDPALVRAALDYRFGYLFYPIAPDALVSVAFHAALPLAAWLWWWRHGDAGRGLSPLAAVLAATVALGFGGTAAIQAVGAWLDRGYADIQQLRLLRLAYPVLLAGLAVLYARLLARRTWRARLAVLALLAASLVPPGSVIHAVSAETRGAVKAWLGMGPPRTVGAVRRGDPRPALWAWVGAHTPRDALVHTDDFEFRLRTRRAITGSFKDGALLFLAGSGPFTAWYRTDRERAACRAARGRDCWFALAIRLGADHVVVDPGLAGATPPPGWVRVWAADGWALWRAGPAG